MSVIFFAVATLAAGVLSMDLLPGVFPADEALQLYLRIHDEYVPIPDDYIVELRPNSLVSSGGNITLSANGVNSLLVLDCLLRFIISIN